MGRKAALPPADTHPACIAEGSSRGRKKAACRAWQRARKQRRPGLPAGFPRSRGLHIAKQPKTRKSERPDGGSPQWKPPEQPNILNRESNRRKDPRQSNMC